MSREYIYDLEIQKTSKGKSRKKNFQKTGSLETRVPAIWLRSGK